ncbi:MAG: 50S ribosomal protein L10 [Muribaculaceae bacterium]|nr:50S ribosomal protein L10 [Muribaculaceae bacterium]MDD7342154.1 50S ribosomal protein L10 [Bacteroidales bacterium]MDY3912077.1 50S ribosomal protein L10 [Sodaliphilus sp.]
MRKEDKAILIENIKATLANYSAVYLTETATLNAEKTTALRRAAFKADVKLMVVKNSLLHKAMEESDVDYSGLYGALAGSTTLMLSNTGNAPAKLIKSFRQKKETIPALKAAFVEESVYMGEDQLEVLANIKSKNELIADVVALLQSPAKNVVSALQSGGSKLHGILETLSNKEE